MVLSMGKKKVFLLLVSLVFVMSLAAGAAFAQEDNFIERIFEPFGGIDVASTYTNYSTFIDALLYFLFFIGIAQFALSKQFEGRGGKAVIIAFGLALSVGITVWTSSVGFVLGDRLGPIAAAIFMLIFFIFIIKIFKGDKEEGLMGPSWWLAVGAAYIFINMLFPELLAVFEANRWGSIAVAIFNFMFLLAVIYGIPKYLSRHFGGGGGESGERRPWGGFFGRGDRRDDRDSDAGRDEEEDEREEDETAEAEERVDKAELAKEDKFLKGLKAIRKDVNNLFKDKEKLKAYSNPTFKNTMKAKIKWIRKEGFELIEELKKEIQLDKLTNAIQNELKIKNKKNPIRQLILKEKNFLTNLTNVTDEFEKFIDSIPNRGKLSEETVKKARKYYLYRLVRLTEVLIDLNKNEIRILK
jgi:hypothetical protein